MTAFTEFGLAEPIQRALAAAGYDTPTPIQQQAIPALLEGRDLLGIAQTGTGKTAAFSLPSIHHLSENPEPRKNAGCRMLVLSPTRELAAQIADNMRGYAKFLNLSIQCVFGGLPIGKQARALERGCDVLVATPGRLLDLVDSRALTLRHVEIFVLDEADQMLDLGFIKPLERIAGMLPQKRQSLFFSATMPSAIAKLGEKFINNPVRVEVAPQSTTAERVEQYATFLNQSEKQALLTLSLRKGLGDKSIDRALVFTRTKHGADRVVRHLVGANISASAIHGNKSQAQRTAALRAFRDGSQPVLVATDIAARGIDVSGVSHVFNFELPNVPEQYVHRIGRTARAGADGIAISFVAPDEKPYLRDIEKLTRTRAEQLPLPDDFMAEAKKLPAPVRVSKGASEAPAEGEGRSRARRNSGPKRPPRSVVNSMIRESGEFRERRPDRKPRRDEDQGAARNDARPARNREDGFQRREHGDARPQRERGEFRPRREGDDRGPRRERNEGPRRERNEGQRSDFGRRDGGEGRQHRQRDDARPRTNRDGEFRHGDRPQRPRRDGEQGQRNEGQRHRAPQGEQHGRPRREFDGQERKARPEGNRPNNGQRRNGGAKDGAGNNYRRRERTS